MLNRNFVLLWQGLFVSQVGTQLFSLALLYWILETTGSATIMGLVLMAATLPGVLLGPFGGTLADNISRKHIIVAADLIRGFAGIGFVLVLWYGNTAWALPALLLCQVVFGICSAPFTAAVGASIPELVPKDKLASANSLLQGTNALTTTASFGLGGFLYAALGAPYLFLINGISYLISATTECFIRIPQKLPEERMSRANALVKFRVETVEGLSYVWRRPGLRLLVGLLSLINFVIIPTAIALPILVRDFLGRGPEFLGIMGACQAAGGLAGFIVAGTLKIPPGRRPVVVLLGLVFSGITIIILGNLSRALLTLPLLTLFGFIIPLINVNIISVLQGTTPSEIRGRVMGVMGTVMLSLIPFAQGLSGLLIDGLNKDVPILYTVVGGALVLLIALAWRSADLRRFLATDY